MSIDCLNPTATLMGTSSSANVTFNWTGPGIDMTNQNLANPNVNMPGIYTLIVTDNINNCDSPISTLMVFDNTTIPFAQIDYNGSLDCNNASVLLDGSSSSNSSTIEYQWYYNNNLIITANTNQYDANNNGQYILVVTNTTTGCFDSDTAQVSLNNTIPIASIATPNELDCNNTSINLDASASSTGVNVQYNWTTLNGNISTGGNSTMPTINQAGSYILEVTNLLNGCAETDTVIVIQNIVAPIASAGPNGTLGCNINDIVLDGSGSSTGINFSYSWSGSVSNPNILSPSVSNSGTYTLTVTDSSNGCTATDAVSINIDLTAPEEIRYTVVNSLCYGDDNSMISIDSVVGGVGPYLYTINGEAFSNKNIFTNLLAGAYTIAIQDMNGCELFESIIINEPIPIAIELGDNITLQLGDSISLNPQINILPNQVDTIIWNPYELLTQCNDTTICFDPFITPTYTTTVSATLVDTNGCIVNDKITIFVEKDEFVYIPSAFSPDDDGINDIFMIYGSKGIEQVNMFRVFSRWGALIFEAENFQPNNPKYGWDGFLKNKKLNPAVFVYYAEIKFIDGHTTTYKGGVTLIR